MSLFVICAGAVALAVVGLVVSEHRNRRRGIWLNKPIASAAFVTAALAHGALGSVYGKAILGGLVLSLIGDLLLIPQSSAFFQAGLGVFLLGHLCFAAAFVLDGAALSWTLGAAVPLMAVVVIVGRWLWPGVPKKMRPPVVAYMLVISTMVALATGHVGAHGRALPLAAALLFYASDLCVARDKFVAPGFVNRLWGLPLYYAAQLLFAATIPL